ncbi:MAG: thioredoxin family protein, partial [Odoribacter sp.]|nr:thioredoxin family protein [Odoribacter sp.]
MKRYLWSLVCILMLPLLGYAQGVNFREVSYAEALELAAKERKMVFIDFYTAWCGPCKQMSKEVFPQREVGDFFNRKFVSLKVDAEKGEGKELAVKYKLRAYPTFVVLNAGGEEVYRT